MVEGHLTDDVDGAGMEPECHDVRQICAPDGADADPEIPKKIAVFCVGSKLMLDDGLGTAVYEELVDNYSFPDNVQVLDVGCMSMDMIGEVDRNDILITVDAVDGTGEKPGTLFRFLPDDMEVKHGATASLHELTLADLFETARLLGYEADGVCLGMQIENMSPEYAVIGLTPQVDAALPSLVDLVLSELYSLGVRPVYRKTGEPIEFGWSHPADAIGSEQPCS